ncbi:hypothetical protein, partial [Paenibacillus faecis]|uniref:hypothetical protein n=1 Tax=Paenibacillus faecis TaxID=862114 RepID=UPI001BCEA827
TTTILITSWLGVWWGGFPSSPIPHPSTLDEYSTAYTNFLTLPFSWKSSSYFTAQSPIYALSGKIAGGFPAILPSQPPSHPFSGKNSRYLSCHAA